MYRTVFADIIPNDFKYHNTKDIMVNCPFHNDTNASFSISTDENKPVYYCFGCKKKGSWVGYYMERNKLSYPEAMEKLGMEKQKCVSEKPKPCQKIIDYTEIIVKATNLTESDFRRLYALTGITMPTAVACSIGFNYEGWVFPVFRYPDFKCVGYEIRHKDFKKDVFISKRSGKPTKVLKAPYTPSCLCYIYKGTSERCFITEGFKDGYFLWQSLSEKSKEQSNLVKDTIISPSNGVADLFNLIKENKLNEFKEICFILDNDKAGNKAKEKIKQLDDDRFMFFDGLQEDEDFEMYYKRTKGA